MPKYLEYCKHNKSLSFNLSINVIGNTCGIIFWLVNLAELMICEIENKVRFLGAPTFLYYINSFRGKNLLSCFHHIEAFFC